MGRTMGQRTAWHRACGNWAVAIGRKIGEIDLFDVFFSNEEKQENRDLTT